MILFLHIHKAAGSSIARLFSSVYRPPPGHFYNAQLTSVLNPRKIVDWVWGKSDAEIVREARSMISRGIEFVSLEWTFPRPSALAALKKELGVVILLGIRDPYRRAVSDYKFTYKSFVKRGILNTKTWPSFGRFVGGQWHRITSAKPNYLVHMMSGQDEDVVRPLGKPELELAKRAIDLCDHIIVVERPDTHTAALAAFERIHETALPRHNVNKKDHGDQSKCAVTGDNRFTFEYANRLDRELYGYIIATVNGQ